jgi:hypothetical protein
MRAQASASASSALYDSACELLDAAQRLRRAAQRPGSEEALAPTLGCLSETSKELAHLSDELCRRLIASEGPDVAVMAAGDALDVLTDFFACGEQLCDSARAAAALRPCREGG